MLIESNVKRYNFNLSIFLEELTIFIKNTLNLDAMSSLFQEILSNLSENGYDIGKMKDNYSLSCTNEVLTKCKPPPHFSRPRYIEPKKTKLSKGNEVKENAIIQQGRLNERKKFDGKAKSCSQIIKGYYVFFLVIILSIFSCSF